MRTAAVLRWLPDSSAIRLTVISLTGLALLFYLKLKRFPGLLVAMGGAAAPAAVVMSWPLESRAPQSPVVHQNEVDFRGNPGPSPGAYRRGPRGDEARRRFQTFQGTPSGGSTMKRTAIAIAIMIGATVLAQLGTAQPPGGQGNRGARGPGRGGPPNPLLQMFDTDHDGTLSAAEIDAAAAKLRERDANKDGKLTADELPRGPGGRVVPVSVPAARPGADGSGAATRASRPCPRTTARSGSSPPSSRPAGASGTPTSRRPTAGCSASSPSRSGAKRVVELGTSTGESGLWFSMALRKTGGKLYTHDIDPGRIAVARENFKRAGVEDIVVITEGDAHETAPRNKDPIDVLFIDAEKEGYDAYLKELLPYVRPGGLIIAHNMRRPEPNPRYIEAITTSPDLDTSFVLMDGAGVGITLKKR